MVLIFLLQPGKGSVRRIRTAPLIPRPQRSSPYPSRFPGPYARIIYAAICRINGSTLIIPASGRSLLLDSGAGNGRKVTLFQNDAMVHLVARGNESQRSHRHFFLVGDSATCPSSFRE